MGALSATHGHLEQCLRSTLRQMEAEDESEEGGMRSGGGDEGGGGCRRRVKVFVYQECAWNRSTSLPPTPWPGRLVAVRARKPLIGESEQGTALRQAH
jgi:hypothetical protein